MGTLHELLNTVADHHSLYDSLCSYFSASVTGTGGLHPAYSIVRRARLLLQACGPSGRLYASSPATTAI